MKEEIRGWGVLPGQAAVRTLVSRPFARERQAEDTSNLEGIGG